LKIIIIKINLACRSVLSRGTIQQAEENNLLSYHIRKERDYAFGSLFSITSESLLIFLDNISWKLKTRTREWVI